MTDLAAAVLARDVVRASGPDAVGFLQGQLSQDVAGLAVGGSAFSLLLQPTGKVDAFLRVTRTGDEEVVLDVDAGAGPDVLARLERFKLRVRWRLAPLEWSCLAVRGDGAEAAVPAPPGAWRVVAETPGLPGFDLLGPDLAVPDGVEVLGAEAYEALRIERGVPRMGAELTERTIPAEAGVVERSVSFTKGCYTGQELVARIDSRGGNVPRRLRGLVLPLGAEAPVGAEVEVEGRSVGALTSVAPSVTRGATVALAYVARAVTPPVGATVRWDGGEADAVVHPLPAAVAVGAGMRAVAHGVPLKRVVRVGPAEIAYVETGRPGAPPVVLLHGFPTHSHLWRHVQFELGDDVHALAPDLLGLGDTVVSPYEDLSAPMQAELLLEWLDRLGLERVALVAHDQGGAVAQQVVANHPERVSHLALVDVVAYDNWPAPLVASIVRLARTPGLDTLAYALDLPRRAAHNARIGFARAVYDRRCMTRDAVEEYLRPLATSEGRERARRFLLAADDRYTLECVPGLRAFAGPALVAWAADDAFLSPSWGARLVGDLPGAERLELIPFCGHLVPEERPAELAGLLRRLLAR